jgi:hypothetical protein
MIQYYIYIYILIFILFCFLFLIYFNYSNFFSFIFIILFILRGTYDVEIFSFSRSDASYAPNEECGSYISKHNPMRPKGSATVWPTTLFIRNSFLD